MKAIIVDDSRATRAIVKRALTAHGFEVVEAGDGKAALDEMEKAGGFDLAVVDWNMPVMNGYELICAVRKRPELGGMPILMLTTETEVSQVEKAKEAGANEYLTKPFTNELLTEKLDILGLHAA
ncbi:MAG: response regulator [Gemmatimonadetes bacterium]|nr:response regulator [Gemmatimonadota bacterium]